MSNLVRGSTKSEGAFQTHLCPAQLKENKARRSDSEISKRIRERRKDGGERIENKEGEGANLKGGREVH